MPKFPVVPMAKFRLDMAVSDLWNAYEAALSGLRAQQDEIEETVRWRHNIGKDDELPGWADAMDDELARTYEWASEKNESAVRGIEMVGTAFLIALFHLWERHCNVIQQRAVFSTSAPKQMEFKPAYRREKATLEELELAANCAKHGVGRSCAVLFQQSPHLFTDAARRKGPSHLNLAVPESRLIEYFDAVRSAARKDF
ncbi:MAG TPA: hypothetical protein DF282_05665 [Hyphomonas sp.]|nr:hypothetical protein [Hyphomonas sp.]